MGLKKKMKRKSGKKKSRSTSKVRHPVPDYVEGGLLEAPEGFGHMLGYLNDIRDQQPFIEATRRIERGTGGSFVCPLWRERRGASTFIEAPSQARMPVSKCCVWTPLPAERPSRRCPQRRPSKMTNSMNYKFPSGIPCAPFFSTPRAPLASRLSVAILSFVNLTGTLQR